MRLTRPFFVLALASALGVSALGPATIASAASPSTSQCEKAWYEWQYSSVAPGFPTTLSPKDRNRIVKQCKQAGRLPNYDAQVKITQKAFNVTAQILEREIARVSLDQGLEICAAAQAVLKPVGLKGRPLQPGDNVEGYAADSFLPILKYNWRNGPFRLKWSCGAPLLSLWFLADIGGPYLDEEHADRYPTDQDVDKDPWIRIPVQGPMSTCITWGPKLDNAAVGGRGYVFSFNWNRRNLPLDVRSCYPRALGEDGLGKYPFKKVPNLPL